MRKVAIFDIDGTLFRSSLLIEFVEVLVERGVFDASVRDEFVKEKKQWLDRKGDYESYIQAVVASFLKNIKGVHYDEFDKAAEIVTKRYKSRVYRYTRDFILELHRKKYFLLAISHSPKRLIDGFCESFGFDKVYGTFYELGPSDRFTGEVTDLHLIMNKANIVRRIVEKDGFSLEGSIGVGDTESDIPFLELVEKPIAFNPNASLYRHAKRNHWKVVVERKDVVYEIS